MKKLLVVVGLFLALVFMAVRQGPALQRSHPRGGPMDNGSEEDHNALAEWNLERLQDPATGRIPDNIREKELAFARHLPHRAVAKSLSWVQQGPRNRGGRTRAVRVDITDSNVLIAGSVTGGIFRSTDAGSTWTRTTAPLDIQNTSCLMQDMRAGHEQTWYCGTGENYGVVSGTSFDALLPGDGIFKSTDGGLSWARLQSTVSNTPQDFGPDPPFSRISAFKHVNSIVVDPLRMDSDIVVAAIFDGIVRSNDGGATWSTVLGLDTTNNTTSLHTTVQVSPNGVYYAAIGRSASFKGLYRSVDGLHWTNITAGSAYPGNVDRTVIGIDPSNDSTAWFLTNIYGGQARHDHILQRYNYLSGDGTGTGGQWTDLSANLPNDTCTGFYDFDFGYFNTQTDYDMGIAVHPDDPNVVFLCGTSVYRSNDGWSTPNNYHWIGGYQCDTDDPKNYVWPHHHPDQHGLFFKPGDASVLYSFNDGGVQMTNDPMADSVSWTELDHGYYSSQFYTVAIEEGAATSPFIIGGLQDNGTYMCTNSDPDLDWASIHGSDGAYCAIPEGRPFMLMSGQQGKLYKKTVQDDGTITAFERIDPYFTDSTYNFINQMVLDPVTNNTLYWCHSTRVYRHSDLASIPLNDNYYSSATTGWEQVDVPGFNGRSCALDISVANPNSLMVGTTSGRLYRIDSLYTNPTRVVLTSDSFPGYPRYVSCVAPNDFNPAEWLVTFCNYGVKSVFLTEDSGATWTSVSGNIEENPDGTGNGPAVFWATIYPTWNGENNRYFIGTSTGLYSTALLDGDNTVWEQEGGDLIGNVPINMMAARGSDGFIAVGTHGSGVFTSHLPAAPIGVAEVTGDLALGHAWPNPATDEAHFDIYLRDAATAEVRIFDLNGRAVLDRTLGRCPNGNSRFTWDLRSGSGARVSQGTYLVQVSAGGTARTTRLVVR